jgi:hypothetical protein
VVSTKIKLCFYRSTYRQKLESRLQTIESNTMATKSKKVGNNFRTKDGVKPICGPFES